ncbi:hypothetical protein BDFB_012636 [Asbolus verrucosus]|uniref:Uncharacterized protein n=1 Tax=Asbolus verrucosus TaxID=1661398 RepID=A0A482W2M6_ASBVE|nr:hypothetical protein BDFB_012636 [Asbolus verrucosus]
MLPQRNSTHRALSGGKSTLADFLLADDRFRQCRHQIPFWKRYIFEGFLREKAVQQTALSVNLKKNHHSPRNQSWLP